MLKQSETRGVVSCLLLGKLARDGRITVRHGTAKLCDSRVTGLFGKIRVNARHDARSGPLGGVSTETAKGVGNDLVLTSFEERCQKTLAGTVGGTHDVRGTLAEQSGQTASASIEGPATLALPCGKRLHGTKGCASGRRTAIPSRNYRSSHAGSLEQSTSE